MQSASKFSLPAYSPVVDSQLTGSSINISGTLLLNRAAVFDDCSRCAERYDGLRVHMCIMIFFHIPQYPVIDNRSNQLTNEQNVANGQGNHSYYNYSHLFTISLSAMSAALCSFVRFACLIFASLVFGKKELKRAQSSIIKTLSRQALGANLFRTVSRNFS